MEKKQAFNWIPAIILITYQALLLITLPFYFYFAEMPSLGLIITSIVLLYLTGMSITAGYHRYYSHRSYKVNPLVEWFLFFFGSMASQGSILRWSYDHRLHHAHVDTDEDPYSINKGFWYAHCFWLLEKPRKIDPKVVPDLMKNKLVQFQHKYILSCMIFSNVIAFFIVAWIFNDYWGTFFIATWLRIFALHHFTWFINSLAHTWGDKPFCQEQTAVNNFVIAFLTFGEGYHNFHHTFANDYRNGIRWYHFDPTKWLIWTLSKLGLATGLKTVDSCTIRKRLVVERKNLLLDKLCNMWSTQKEELEKKVLEMSERLLNEIAEINNLIEKYRILMQKGEEPTLLQQLNREIETLKRNLKNDWKQWKQLSRNILRMPTPVLST